jgi:DNA repair protein RecO (recombination protein O)
MRNVSTEGIILKRHIFGEHDRVITLFSPEYGKIVAFAKGARKVTSHFAGHLEPLTICEFELYQSAKGFTITQCRSIETFTSLRSNLEKTLLASLISEIFDKTSFSGERAKELFSLIKTSLEELGRSGKHRLTVESFKIKLMQLNGILPNTRLCGLCRKKLEENGITYLDRDGSIVCGNCIKENTESGMEPVPFNQLKLISYILNSDFNEIGKIAITKEQETELKKLTDIFLDNYVGKIKSEEIIRGMPS